MLLELQALSAAISAGNGARALLSGWLKKKPTDEDVRAVQDCINELLGQLSQATVDMASLRGEHARLTSELAALRVRADLRAKRTSKDGAYFITEPPAGYASGPYCSGCWDAKDLQVLLRKPTDHDRMISANPGKTCPSCQQEAVP